MWFSGCLLWHKLPTIGFIVKWLRPRMFEKCTVTGFRVGQPLGYYGSWPLFALSYRARSYGDKESTICSLILAAFSHAFKFTYSMKRKKTIYQYG